MIDTQGKHYYSQVQGPKKLLVCLLREQAIVQYDKYPHEDLLSDYGKGLYRKL